MISDAKSMLQLATQMKNGIIKHVSVRVKIIVRAEKAIVGILAYVFVRMVSIEKVLLIIPKLFVMISYMLCILYQQMCQILHQQMPRVLCQQIFMQE